METELSRALNDAVVGRLAGDRTYRRGQDYYQHGHVESLENDAADVRAVVRGSQDYTVVLSAADGVPDYACDRPQGAEGAFCKHCVAAALAWLNRDTAPASTKAKEVTLADAAKALQDEDKETVLLSHEVWEGAGSHPGQMIGRYRLVHRRWVQNRVQLAPATPKSPMEAMSGRT